MSEIVNLNRVRKAKARQLREEKAAENRARFGVAKKDRSLTKAQNALTEKTLDTHHLGSGKPPKE